MIFHNLECNAIQIIIVTCCFILFIIVFCICVRAYVNSMIKIRDRHRLSIIKEEANKIFKNKITPANLQFEEFKDNLCV